MENYPKNHMEQSKAIEEALREKGGSREAAIWRGISKQVKPVASNELEELVEMILDMGGDLLKLISWRNEDKKQIVFRKAYVSTTNIEPGSRVFKGNDRYVAVFKARRDILEIRYHRLYS